MKPAIFVSYRRVDEPYFVQGLRDHLVAAFPDREIFVDVDRIRAGQRFSDVIDATLASSDLVLVVIGPSWLSAADGDGGRRLDDPEDWVRREIEEALVSGKIVIPVLVGGATVPAAVFLPTSLRPLVDRQAIRVSADRMRSEMARLVAQVRLALDDVAEQRSRRAALLVRKQWSATARRASGLKSWRPELGEVAAALRLRFPWLVRLALLGGGSALAAMGLASAVTWYLVAEVAEVRWRMNAADLSPKAEWVATATGQGRGTDGRVRIWDANEGHLLHSVRETNATVWAVAWSPDGRHLAYGDFNGILTILAVEGWQSVRRLRGHTGILSEIAWSPDGTRVCAGDENGVLRVWDIATGELQFDARSHMRNIDTIRWSPTGDRIASGSWDATVVITEASTGAVLHRLEGHTSFVTSVAWSPDGRVVASGGSKAPFLMTWSLEEEDKSRVLTGHASGVESLAWSPTGSSLASASSDHTIGIWNLSGTMKQRLPLDPGSRGEDVSWSPDGTLLAATTDRQLWIWQAESWRPLQKIDAYGNSWGVDILGWSPDSERLATLGYTSNAVKTWNIEDGRRHRTFDVSVLQAIADGLF